MKWKTIDSAPRDGTRIVVTAYKFDEKENGRFVVIAKSDGQFWIDDNEDTIHPPTHWMPLPELPE